MAILTPSPKLLSSIILILLTFYLLAHLTPHVRTSQSPQPQHPHHPNLRIAKATILYPSHAHPYQRALHLHEQQNNKYGYEMHVLREPIVSGAANVLYFLVSVLIEEMQKGGEGWVLYFDPGILPLQPSQGLEFLLPPAFVPYPDTGAVEGVGKNFDEDKEEDHPHDPSQAFETLKALSFLFPAFPPFLQNRSSTSTSNTKTLHLSIFWLRIHPLTLHLLNAAISEIHATTHLPGPEQFNGGGEVDVAAAALQHVLHSAQAREREKGGVLGLKLGLYQPGEWYGFHDSRSQRLGYGSGSSFARGGEGGEGAVFAQPGRGSAFVMLKRLERLVERVEKSDGRGVEGWVGIKRKVRIWWVDVVLGE